MSAPFGGIPRAESHPPSRSQPRPGMPPGQPPASPPPADPDRPMTLRFPENQPIPLTLQICEAPYAQAIGRTWDLSRGECRRCTECRAVPVAPGITSCTLLAPPDTSLQAARDFGVRW